MVISDEAKIRATQIIVLTKYSENASKLGQHKYKVFQNLERNFQFSADAAALVKADGAPSLRRLEPAE